jgi:hypothetical protein
MTQKIEQRTKIDERVDRTTLWSSFPTDTPLTEWQKCKYLGESLCLTQCAYILCTHFWLFCYCLTAANVNLQSPPSRDALRSNVRWRGAQDMSYARHSRHSNLNTVLVPCPVRDLIDMVDIISINSRCTLFPLSGADNAALGPFYLVLLLYKNKTYRRSKSR